MQRLEAGARRSRAACASAMLAMALPGEERFAAGDACGVGEFDALLLCELPFGDELFFKLDEAAAGVAPASATGAGAGAGADAGVGVGAGAGAALGVFISAAEYLSALARSSSGASSGSGGSSGGSCGGSGASLSTSLMSAGEAAEQCAAEAAPLAPLPACWSSSPSADAPARRKRSVSSYCEASSACGGSSVSSCSGDEALVASARDAAAPAKRQRRRGLGADETRGLSPSELRVLKKRHKMERNRQLAHESRERRKNRLVFLENENRRLASRVRELEAEFARLGRGSSKAPPAPALRKGKGGEPLVQGAAAMAATMSMVLFADGSGSAAGSAPGAVFGAGLASHWAAGWGAQLWLLRMVLPLGQAAVLLLATLAALVLGVLYVRLAHACLSSGPGPVALVNGVAMAAASPRGGARVVTS